jgi:gas vesicle protein
VWGFLAGAAASAVYTLLKTPRSGHETIDQIKGQGSRLKTQAGDKMGGLLHHAEESTGGWPGAAPSAPQYWQADLQDTAQQAQAAVENIAKQTQDQGDQAVDAVQAAAGDAMESINQTLKS